MHGRFTWLWQYFSLLDIQLISINYKHFGCSLYEQKTETIVIDILE